MKISKFTWKDWLGSVAAFSALAYYFSIIDGEPRCTAFENIKRTLLDHHCLHWDTLDDDN